MFSYLIRRLLYAIPILFGVMLITFLLFFVVQPPYARARAILGEKARPAQVQQWLHDHGYDKPTYLNTKPGQHLFDSLFVNQMKRLITFDFGVSDKTSLPIAKTFTDGVIPSLCLTLPAFVIGFIMAVTLSLYQVFIRYSALDRFGVFLCVALMSIPPMIYMFVGQRVLAMQLNYFPAYGFDLRGWQTAKFVLLPVTLMIVMYLGNDVRLYRTIFLEEITQDYVRTALAKGVPQSRVLFVHVLKNGMISLITLVVAHLPFLIMGSLLLENFFGIPGLGNALIHAIQTGDAAMTNALVYLGALFYLAGLMLTDICYAFADPRIRLS
ncbi:binding-protein-dependent transport systems inner membrane component [Chthoniobacter flavus Ellin428]|uniref:Binding-protein-dependent transport systems inner membrane component n=1 Tax=Chthoniobacter flavus Ellin428 TaxID=497964 RepID=B4D3K4_9BACT|nr:ABC transporter permease [Chthoniobacter flavus]EDY18834.1 binding-protein-dependent transport systems inner membrane component [Chthoniobacter flavus Ellin428]TCO93432.1 peptide/nickel transport system permease protein [Chthoniobacter flavus]